MKNSLLISFMSGCLLACSSGSSDKADRHEYQWQPPAGAATSDFDAELDFLQFVPNLDILNYPAASLGRELFVADWDPAPGSRPLLDGIGPLLITNACDNCHLANGRAASLNGDGSIGVGLLFRLGSSTGMPDSHFGGQLQTAATSGLAEGSVSWQALPSGRPQFSFSSNSFALDDDVRLSPRLSPQLLGLGLLELIPDAAIAAREDIDDADNNGISGRIHWRNGAIGRYGWKAMQATLKGQSAGALQQDMGLTSTVNPSEPCTVLQSICQQEASGGSPEVSAQSLDAINAFLSLLAVPDRRIEDQDRFNRGSDIFVQVDCQLCHQPTYTTGASQDYPFLSAQLIYPYTDFLLHDMGAGLSEGMPEGDAQAQEWRTPPLWGLGLIEQVEGSRFLHDGRAQTIEQAILFHDGEAQASKTKFEQVNAQDKADLLLFLRAI